MKSIEKDSIIDRYKKKVKVENRKYVAKNLQISEQISEILERKGLTQKDLATLLGKHESEVSKLMSGLHNLTLKSITKIESVLDENIILTPLEACQKYSRIEYIILKVTATKNYAGAFKNKCIPSDYKNPAKQEKAA